MASLPTKEIERRSGVESGTSGLRYVVRFTSASGMMCVGWDVGCRMRWYACIGVPPSYASFLREPPCKCINKRTQNRADHRALQAQNIRRCDASVFSRYHLLTPTRNVIHELRTGWLRARTEEVVLFWLLKIDFQWWNNAGEEQKAGRAS